MQTGFPPNGVWDFLYGASFSPNESILYVSQSYLGILQYNISVGHILDAPFHLTGTFPMIGQLKLGPDNKIYFAGEIYPTVDSVYGKYLGVINNPDSLGVAL